MPNSQKLRRWQDCPMTCDCTIKDTSGKDNHIADTLSRMQKYPGISTTKDDLIPYSVHSITIKPLQEIPSNHINLSDPSTTSSPTSNQPYTEMPPCRAINFTHVACAFNKCRGRAETTGHYNSCPYLAEDDMELKTKNNCEVIKKADKKVSSD